MDSKGIKPGSEHWPLLIESGSEDENTEGEETLPQIPSAEAGSYNSRPADKLLSDFQITTVPLASELAVEMELPTQCPEWLQNFKNIHNDLRYFSTYFTNDKNKRLFLDGKGTCYNRLVLCLKKLDEIEQGKELTQEYLLLIRGWLSESLKGCPIPWYELPLRINHRNKQYKIPESRKHFVEQDSAYRDEQELKEDFAPPWIESFEINGESAYDLTLAYWNVRNDKDGRVSRSQLEESEPQLCKTLALFQAESAPPGSLKQLQLEVIRSRLKFTDDSLLNLKNLPQKYKYSWDSINLASYREQRKRTSSTVKKPQNSVIATKKRKTQQPVIPERKTESQTEEISRETTEKRYFRKSKLSVEPVEYFPVEELPELSHSSETRRDPLNPPERALSVKVSGKVLADLGLATYLSEGDYHGSNLGLLIRNAAKSVLSCSPVEALPAFDALELLYHQVRDCLDYQYQKTEYQCEQEKKHISEQQADVYRIRLAVLSMAQDELSALFQGVRATVLTHSKPPALPKFDPGLKKYLKDWGEKDIDFTTGRPFWADRQKILQRPLTHLMAALSPDLKQNGGLVSIPPSLLKRMMGPKADISSYRTLPLEKAVFLMQNYMIWIINTSKASESNSQALREHFATAENLIELLLFYTTLRLELEPELARLQCQNLRKLLDLFTHKNGFSENYQMELELLSAISHSFSVAPPKQEK